jgi:mannose-1-phosphate guanylyltransferase/phosphomannomutase
MKAVILPTGNYKNLSPMTDSVPESMLPIVNKPLLEHQIEFLAQHNIKDILVLLKHKPDQVRTHFGSGERWGVKLKIIETDKYEDALDALSQIQEYLEGATLCLQGNVLSNHDVTQLVKEHEHRENNITLCLEQELESSTLSSLLEEHHFMIEPGFLRNKLELEKFNTVSVGQNRNVSKINISYNPTANRILLDSPQAYWKANKMVLENKMKGFVIKGKEISKGIWVGAHSEIHPKAILRAPLIVGDHCVINKNALIEQGNVIGDHSIIDEEACLFGSIIWEGTYTGTQTDIKDSVVNKNLLFNIPRKTMLRVADPFLLGDSEPDINIFRKSDRKKPGSILRNKFFSFPMRAFDRAVIAFNIFKAHLKLQKKTMKPKGLGSIFSSKTVNPKFGTRP